MHAGLCQGYATQGFKHKHTVLESWMGVAMESMQLWHMGVGVGVWLSARQAMAPSLGLLDGLQLIKLRALDHSNY